MKRIIAILIILSTIVSCGRLSDEYQKRLNQKQQEQIDSLYILLNKRDSIPLKSKEISEKYYVVIGSFSNIENAYDMQLNNSNLNTKVLYIKDYYRVVVDSASNVSILTKKYENIKDSYTEEIITIRDD